VTDLAVDIRVLEHGRDLGLPGYASPGAAGLDLMAALDSPEILECGGHAVIPTGIAIALPAGFEGQVRPRSGLAARHGITVLNAPGTVDADYRGEIKVVLVNHGPAPFTVERGARIAQLVIARHARISWSLTDSLPETQRGQSGFGSTGSGSPAGHPGAAPGDRDPVATLKDELETG